jgi:hypothetical protein
MTALCIVFVFQSMLMVISLKAVKRTPDAEKKYVTE